MKELYTTKAVRKYAQYRSLTILPLLLTIAARPALAQSQVPRGAFLTHPVHSDTQLLQELRKDKLVSARFSRLFNMSPEMVRMAFAKLHLEHTKNELVRKVYYVHPGEQIGYRVRRIKKGTLVFAYPDGTPVLLQVCGNPLRPSPQPVVAFQSARPAVPDYSDDDAVPVASAGVGTAYLIRPVQPELALASRTTSDFVPEVSAVQSDRPVPAFHSELPAATLRTTASNQLLGWVGGAGLIGALAAFQGSGSSSPRVAAITPTSTTPNGVTMAAHMSPPRNGPVVSPANNTGGAAGSSNNQTSSGTTSSGVVMSAATGGISTSGATTGTVTASSGNTAATSGTTSGAVTTTGTTSGSTTSVNTGSTMTGSTSMTNSGGRESETGSMDSTGDKGEGSGGDNSVVPEANSLGLFVCAAGGGLFALLLKKRFAVK